MKYKFLLPVHHSISTVILITVSVLVLLVFVALESSIPQTPSPSSHEVGSPLVREGEGEK